MSKDLIFIFEFVSGGGFSQVNIPTSLFCEGFGMLRSIIADFKALGFEIHTLLDLRIFFLSKFLQADVIRKVDEHENYLKAFKNLVKNCKYIFIIAPETSKILYELTKLVKNSNKILLSTNLHGIKKGTSKILTYNFFKKSGIFTPKTYRIPYIKKQLDKEFILQKFKTLKCPIVIKPEDGCGAESIHYFEKESQILYFLRNYKLNSDKTRHFILQEFIKGEDLSISLLGNKNLNTIPLVLSVNSQNINLKNIKSEYFGGYTPLLNHKEITKQLFNILKKINLLKIEGHFGIDFIRKHDHSFSFIEINPRLTTSYIGLRNIININCAELILNSRLNNLNDPEINLQSHSNYTRLDFLYDNFENGEEYLEDLIPKFIKLIPEFVTPPISLNNSKYFSCFIATKTKDLLSSEIRVNEIIQSMKNLNFNISMPRKIKLS